MHLPAVFIAVPARERGRRVPLQPLIESKRDFSGGLPLISRTAAAQDLPASNPHVIAINDHALSIDDHG